MITLDKIKLVAPIKYIEITDKNRFEVHYKEDVEISYRFTQTQPYLLYVEANVRNKELIIEFTGKILKDDYPKLINQSNIRHCLSNISDMGLCQLDVEGILTEGEVVKADITQDIPYPNCKELTKAIQAHIVNFSKYQARIIHGNFIVEKNVATKNCKRRLTIYDKEKELNRAENREFLSTLSDKEGLLNYFKGKIRFEMNLNSKEQIRKALHISHLSLQAVLGVDTHPIWEFIDKITADTSPIDHAFRNYNELLRGALLQVCDNDMEQVEAKLRLYCSPKTHITQLLKPYRQLLEKMKYTPSIKLKQTLRSFLLEVIILFAVVAI